MNDEKLITAIQNRDETAISDVITRYSRLLWKTASAVLKNIGSTQDVEECVADTFIYLWEHPDRYDARRGKLKTWLSIVARTQAVNRCREIAKRKIIPLEDAGFLSQTDIVDGVLHQETQRTLAASINALEEPAREILIRRYYYEQKPKEIARALGLNVKQVNNTLKITAGALCVGIVIGIIVAAIRSSYDKNLETLKLRGGFGFHLFRLLNGICRLYLTVIRGTPVVVQLMICYFVIFVSAKDGIPVAIFAFGINSGAYVAEIFRGGIMSIDGGQFEAGRSLGFNYLQTMWHIIIPQMFKAVLPTLCNEFIALLKETSVAGYVGVVDLTKAGNIIAGRTYDYFIPLFTVALVYLFLVVVLSWLVGRLERRLRRSER